MIYAISLYQNCDRLVPSARFQNINLEQRLGKKINDVNSFKVHFSSIKEMITYFKDKNHKSKMRYENCKTLDRISVDTIATIGATSTSICLSITGFSLIILPISAAIACTLSLGKQIRLNIHNKNS